MRGGPDLFQDRDVAVDGRQALQALADSLNASMPGIYLLGGGQGQAWQVDGNKVAFRGRLNIVQFGAFKGWLYNQSSPQKAGFVFADSPNARLSNMIKTLPPSPTLQIHLIPQPAAQQQINLARP